MYKKTSTLCDNADAILADGINNRDNLLDAVDLVIELQARAHGLRQLAAKVSNRVQMLGDKAAEWALRSKKRQAALFDGDPFSDQTGTSQAGEINEVGKVYRLVKGVPSIVRANNANMTNEFVLHLPTKWLKKVIKYVPDWVAARKDEKFAEVMADCDLIERPSYKWSCEVKDMATANKETVEDFAVTD